VQINKTIESQFESFGNLLYESQQALE